MRTLSLSSSYTYIQSSSRRVGCATATSTRRKFVQRSDRGRVADTLRGVDRRRDRTPGAAWSRPAVRTTRCSRRRRTAAAPEVDAFEPGAVPDVCALGHPVRVRHEAAPARVPRVTSRDVVGGFGRAAPRRRERHRRRSGFRTRMPIQSVSRFAGSVVQYLRVYALGKVSANTGPIDWCSHSW